MSGSRPQVGPGRVVSEAVQAAVLIPAQKGVDRNVIFGLEVVAQTTHYGVPQLTVRGLGDQLVVQAQETEELGGARYSPDVPVLYQWRDCQASYASLGVKERARGGVGNSTDVPQQVASLDVEFP